MQYYHEPSESEYQAQQLKYGTVKLLNKGRTHWALNLSDGGCPFPKFKVQIH